MRKKQSICIPHCQMDSMTIYKHDYFLNQPKDHHILYVIFEIGAFLAKCQCMHNEWCWWAYNIAQDRLCNLFPSTIHVPSKPVPSLVCLFSCTRQGWQHPDQIHILHIPAEKFAVHIPTHSTPHTSRLRMPLWSVASGSRHLWLIGTWSVRRGLLQGQHMWCETWSEKTSSRWCNRVIRKVREYILGFLMIIN